jgi:Mg-chelatase subunit ChlD
MARFIAKGVAITGLLLMVSAPAFANHYPNRKHVARQNTSPCVSDDLLGRVGASNGGRKIGFVIDASNSMGSNDPNDIRLAASQALNNALIDSSEASDGKTSDLVTVVDFASSGRLVYPLGDPSGANEPIGSISLRGGTAIGTGVEAAIEELTKPGNDPTANRTGIIVFTDGEDDPSSGITFTIEQVKRAADLGIRISFGFLSVDASNQNPEIVRAIVESGGIYATVDQATSQQTFVAAALANGLTGIDASGGNGSSTLLSGLATAKFLSQTGSNTFAYAAKAGETINVTVTAIDNLALEVTLRDVQANTDIKSNTTNSTGVAFLDYTAQSNMDLEVVVSATNGSGNGIFSVGLKSSLPLSDSCNITSNGTTGPPATPTASPPAQYTGGAASTMLGVSANVVGGLFSVLGFAAAAAWL